MVDATGIEPVRPYDVNETKFLKEHNEI